MKSEQKRNEMLIAIILIVIVSFLFGSFGMMGFGNSWMSGMMAGSWWGAGFIFGFLINLLIVIVFVLFILWLLKNMGERI